MPTKLDSIGPDLPKILKGAQRFKDRCPERDFMGEMASIPGPGNSMCKDFGSCLLVWKQQVGLRMLAPGGKITAGGGGPTFRLRPVAGSFYRARTLYWILGGH